MLISSMTENALHNKRNTDERQFFKTPTPVILIATCVGLFCQSRHYQADCVECESRTVHTSRKRSDVSQREVAWLPLVNPA